MKRQTNFFWPSYTDLMTSLFFIMLVLYVLTFVQLKLNAKATEDQLKKIKEIQTAVENLPKNFFEYQPDFKRFTLKKRISFDTGDSKINPNDYEYLINVGNSIKSLISDLTQKYSNENIKYLIVIEGMASNDKYLYNYQLSYERALSLIILWKKNNILFDENICELQIAGSGTGGVGRDETEDNNQRFLIQIIPKIGKLD